MNPTTREILDRLGEQLRQRIPEMPDPGCGLPNRLDLGELGAVASAARDYLEAESIYAVAVANLPPVREAQ